MKHKLYTTYLAKMKNNKDLIPENCAIAIIMRFPPFIPEDSDIIHCPELSPKGILLSKLKSEKITFEEFKNELWNQWKKNELESNKKRAMDTIKDIEEALEHNDVCLVCCEKDPNECHRSFLGEYFEFSGFEWIEL